MSDELDPERKQELTRVALKVAAVVLGIGLVVGIGSWMMVHALGLDDGSSAPPEDTRVQPVQPLPSTALPVPSESVPEDPHGDQTVKPPEEDKGLHLDATPVIVSPMERINLTGHWAGKDNLSLSVQRLEGGQWTDFGVQASLQVGTFETWVMTGREGDNVFRMYDPQSGTASNEVRVTVK